jgi:hypothetical protein
MKILFDEQDVADSVHVFIAAKENRGFVEGSEPHQVKEVELIFDSGFSARGRIHGANHNLSQQDVIDAVAMYLSSYYSFEANRLLIDLAWDETTKKFSAEIVVER